MQHDSFEHHPVMVREVVAIFGEVPPGVVVDATVGAGGHARALLEAYDHISLLGIDRDPEALEAASRSLSTFGVRVMLRRARFDELATVVREADFEAVSGVLLDLGVSSPQLDRPARGFSYRHDAPLDMRMDQSSGMTAAEVVNSYDARQLAEIFRSYGDERYAVRIANAIVAARPLTTTTELADVIRNAVPAASHRGRAHPAKRVFQALRIEVNSELTILASTIDSAIEVLRPRGRCVVISYHSGEDRIVKGRFSEAATGGCVCPQDLPCVCGAQATVSLLRRGALKPSAVEIDTNPRARSARLRAAEKIDREAAA